MRFLRQSFVPSVERKGNNAWLPFDLNFYGYSDKIEDLHLDIILGVMKCI